MYTCTVYNPTCVYSKAVGKTGWDVVLQILNLQELTFHSNCSMQVAPAYMYMYIVDDYSHVYT